MNAQPSASSLIDYAALRGVFEGESFEALDAMEQALLRLEARPDDDTPVATLFRHAHTLKGNAASLRLGSLTELAHVLEDVLDRLRVHALSSSDGLVTLLLEAVDALREMVASASEDDQVKPRHRIVIERLRLVIGAPASGPAPASEGGSAAAATAQPVHSSRTLRVDVAALDKLLDVTGEIAVAHGRLRRTLETDSRQAVETHGEADQLHAELQQLAIRLRMVPLGPMLSRYARVVRDAAASAGKSARLQLRGEDIDVDTKVIEHIADPLTHLVRNCVAHGIETPEARQAAGKEPCGSVVISAKREPGCIVIEISDDGAGLDVQRILAKAHARGLVTAELASQPDEALAQRLIFEPGLSTADAVNELSGRGVGLDVVRRNVEALRGSLRVSSRSGQGTTFTMRLPLTLAIVQGFGVAVSAETFVVPLESVVGCSELPAGLATDRQTGVLDLRGEALPVLRLRQRLAVAGESPSREHVLIVQHDERRVGLIVDRLLGDLQTVIKPMGTLFHGLPGVAGSTILGDGHVALLLDVPAIVDEVAGN